MRTEFASGDRSVSSAYRGLARWAGASLEAVVEHAEAGRLGELIEARSLTRPISGSEALRQLERRRYVPGEKPRSPAALLGELRALGLIWAAEEQHEHHSRDPRKLLAELDTKRWGPG
ncbi:hypothetical protein [Mycobacterium interjectum]|uniref:hypothetical protein n=1 Tax=Mycobacterium interjectum TaxID=33895 RepID=UPI00082E06C0|nr:hypothetical protein [Mycobacterium interjectum]MCV7090207.1 hypothetical protein [Mycobacterium interjectum]